DAGQVRQRAVGIGRGRNLAQQPRQYRGQQIAAASGRKKRDLLGRQVLQRGERFGRLRKTEGGQRRANFIRRRRRMQQQLDLARRGRFFRKGRFQQLAKRLPRLLEAILERGQKIRPTRSLAEAGRQLLDLCVVRRKLRGARA